MRRLLPAIIALTALVLLSQPNLFLPRTYAYPPVCQYSSVAYIYPNEVRPGEHFTVSISLPAVCPQTNNYHYSARFDVENSMNRVLASNYTQDGFVPNNGKPFTFTVTNPLTAPSTPGAWPLQFIVYTFMSEDDANGLDYKVKALETIQVGQPIQLQTVQTTNNTVTSSTTETRTTSTAFPRTNQPVAETAEPTSSNEVYQIVAVVFSILLVLTLIIAHTLANGDGRRFNLMASVG